MVEIRPNHYCSQYWFSLLFLFKNKIYQNPSVFNELLGEPENNLKIDNLGEQILMEL